MRWVPTSTAQLIESQDRLLRHMVSHNYSRGLVPVSNGAEQINFIDSNTTSTSPPLVVTHGFGSGLGFFFNNLDTLHSIYPRTIAVDWLGMGGSSRPSLVKSGLCSAALTPDQAIRFFVDSLEEWRVTMGVSKLTLAGHSLGGFLSVHYALSYPERVSRLILISPVGIPSTTHSAPMSLPWRLRLLDMAWNNTSPQQIVRGMGPRGPLVVERILRQRFGDRWNDTETRLLAEYLYHITVAPGSGEYAMNVLLKPVLVGDRPGVYAREPLDKLLKTLEMPVDLMFGDKDWINHPTIPGIVDSLRGHGVNATMHIIPQAGHHLYLDNTDYFHSVMRQISLQ